MLKMTMMTQRITGLILALCLASPAFAHTDGAGGGLIAGLLHPLTGPDHVVAMVAVGLWGGILGGAAIWQLPVLFPIVMAFAGALGALAVPLPAVETGIALSGVILGLMVLFMVRPPMAVAAGLVGAFAVFHGHAHGAELPESANAFAYALGFVVATGALHLAGIAFGTLIRSPAGLIAVRTAGAVIALIGVAFLTGIA
jgi:urease accessory protein